MNSFPLYGFCLLVSASLVVLLGMSVDFFEAFVSDIVSPCQHDSDYRDGRCNCDNTMGVFTGKYCEECQCKHLGICSMVEGQHSGRWGCRCPSHQKWVGLLCDKCYAVADYDKDTCRGDCLNTSEYAHYGTRCDTVCMPEASSFHPHCSEVSLGGGTCNACNGHGKCSATGQCECDTGFFTSRAGEQCLLTCENCPPEKGTCQNIGGSLQCICNPGFYGPDCEQTCPSVNEKPCSGHGLCSYNAFEQLECACDTHYTGDDCSQRCPGDLSYPTPCSGHGTCISKETEAVCECRGTWDGFDCSCSPTYTCSGHGTCNDNSTCACFDTNEIHFAGSACEKCKEHWWGDRCHLGCDTSKEYMSHPDTDGLDIGCNGHGACSILGDGGAQHVTCVCDRTNPDTYCATCMPDYYPLLTTENRSVPHCSVECNPQTCSYKGICNPDYDGTNDLCICDTVSIGNITYDTLDPTQFCSACKTNWYPDEKDSPNRCTKYCAKDGVVDDFRYIRFGTTDYTLEGDINAQNVCVNTNVDGTIKYEPDADCTVCSDSGTCNSEGQCSCSDGITGKFCEIDCHAEDGTVCSGHGRCKRNDLDLWFNPYTNYSRCECMPYDTYTSETRQRLIKRGFQVDPPPVPQYYGKYCEFHCPRYNTDVCSDRGSCRTMVETDNFGRQTQCFDDSECSGIPGAFCARLSSPWDSLMTDDQGDVSGDSFFEDGPESPGYYTCASSKNCIDAIYSVKWDEFCVNMLNGWYPNILNSAKCAYNDHVDASGRTCQEQVEDFFVQAYDEDQTWCEAAMDVLAVGTAELDVCGPDSHPDDEVFEKTNVPLCYEYSLSTMCNAQSMCIYDQSEVYIRKTDDECKLQTECKLPCKLNNDQQCETATYCRAKTCPDIIYEHSIESMCLDIEPPRCSSDTDWTEFCANATGRIQPAAIISSMDTFYSCLMYSHRHNPQLMEATIQVPIPGTITLYDQVVSIQDLRASVIVSRQATNDACRDVTVSNAFCDAHLQHRLPPWYRFTPAIPSWFAPWIVACPGQTTTWVGDSLWSNSVEAYERISQVDKDCRAFYRIRNGLLDGNGWEVTTEQADTIAYEPSPWTLDCLGDSPLPLEHVDWRAFPKDPSACVLHADELAQRWGEEGWMPFATQDAFTAACRHGLEAPWVPTPPPIPNLCTLGTCHPEDICLPCSDPAADCDESASVQCITKVGMDCRHQNRCRNGGNCYQPLSIRFQNAYLCDYIPNATVSVSVGSQTYVGHLSDRGWLTVLDSRGAIPRRTNITIDNQTKLIMKHYNTSTNDTTLIWSDTPTMTPEQASETNIESLPTCADTIDNWYSFCDGQPKSVELDTSPPFGLGAGWSGDAFLLEPDVLKLTRAVFSSTTIRTELVANASRRIRATCGNTIVEGTNVHLVGNFTSCVVEAISEPARVTALTMDENSSIATYEDAMASTSRQVYVPSPGETVTGFESWFFEDERVMAVNRALGDDLPGNGVCEMSANGTSATCSASPPQGMRWSLPFEGEDVRVTGWTKFTDTNKHVGDVVLLNDDDDTVASIFVLAKRVYVNGIRTHCTVRGAEWWHWSIDATHHNESIVHDSGTAEFDQEWHINVRINDCQWPDTGEPHVHPLRSSTKIRLHAQRVAEPLSDVADVSEDTCHERCVSEPRCLQWSWSPRDHHCYLYEKRCHEDDSCHHGHGILRSIHSHKIASVEVFSEARGGPTTFWSRIRAQPKIHYDPCPVIDASTISSRWQNAFEETYVPYEPDATAVCAAFTHDWQLLPEYKTKVCHGVSCPYEPHDLKACADHLNTVAPSITQPDCDSETFNILNWTAYCYYAQSFDSVHTGVSQIPFLGGLEGEMSQICEEPLKVYDEAREKCDNIPSRWFAQCFQRSEPYEEHCAPECLEHIENRLSSNGTHAGICEHRKSFLDMKTNASGSPSGLSQECECDLNNLVVTDFCIMQDAYHDDEYVKIPELYNSECSIGCSDTLQQSMNRTVWRHWCKDLSDGDIPGTCSKTACTCDTEEYAGVAGKRCELTCPSGFSDGKELACSGANGQCFAKNPSEVISDEENQRKAGEYRDEGLGPLIPEWTKSSSASVSGQCQCAFGSGDACSIPCEGCNNGTYGYDMASQYGICDSFNGICRALPAFMRYNTKQVTEDYISYNTTGFEAVRGVYKWKFPERFLFEDDATVLRQVLLYLNDVNGKQTGLVVPNTTSIQEHRHIRTVLRVFGDLCWDPVKMSLSYLSNEQHVVNRGLEMQVGPRILKTTQLNNWGKCTRVDMTDSLYLCFASGRMYAADELNAQQRFYPTSNPGPLVVREEGTETIPLEAMTFAKRTKNIIYAFGGRRDYEKTSELFNTLYEIKVLRSDWSPYDIVELTWTPVNPTSSVNVPKAEWAPIASVYDSLYMLHGHYLYRMLYSTNTRPASWSKEDFPLSRENINAIWTKQAVLYVSTTNGTILSWVNGTVLPLVLPPGNGTLNASGSSMVPQPAVSELHDGSTWTASQLELPCTMEITSDQLQVASLPMISYSTSPAHVRMYLEEWLSINEWSGYVVERVHQTVRWSTSVPVADLSPPTLQKQAALDMMTRLDMHQSRYTVSEDLFRRHQRSQLLSTDDVRYIPVATVVPDSILNFFSRLPVSILESTPIHQPTNYTVTFEGPVYKRVMLIYGEYNPGAYTQDIDMENNIIKVVTDWSATALNVRLEGPLGDSVEWQVSGSVKTFGLVIHLEEWLYRTGGAFQPSFGTPELFQMYVSVRDLTSYTMLTQLSDFLEYTPSHCSVTASVECPGFLPYVGIPCSGRGACSISCQCTCEASQSKIESSEVALVSMTWMDSPYRGDGCQLTCPGYDGFSHDSICSNRGVCQRDGSCSCDQGYTGDACQFECPINVADGSICSAHGGCGTRVVEPSNFHFTNNAYMDALAAMNRKELSSALEKFYGVCSDVNYVDEPAIFDQLATTKLFSYTNIEDAKAKCNDINANVILDYTKESHRLYPSGTCAGIEMDGTQFSVVVFSEPQSQTQSAGVLASILKCDVSDCNIEVDESDDNTLMGVSFSKEDNTFYFKADYNHGNSKGRLTLDVNNRVLFLDMDWSPAGCLIHLQNADVSYVVVDVSQDIAHVRWSLVASSSTEASMQVELYPQTYPAPHATLRTLVAPTYDAKYRVTRISLTGSSFNVPSADTGGDRPILTKIEAERDCDTIPECEGILQWNTYTRESWFSLYTSDSSLTVNKKEVTLYADTGSSTFLRKMSHVYKGKKSTDEECAPVLARQSRYPSASYREHYNGPIQNIDISRAVDADTGAINVGNGIWTNCWTRNPATTKVGCKEAAANNGAYGFAFHGSVCIIYSGITNPNNIQLNRFNSETSKTIYEPCDSDATWLAT